MIRTYNQTWVISKERLPKATFTVLVHKATKYEAEPEDEIEVNYTGVQSLDIIEGGKEAEEIEAETDASGVDEYHEYLVLHFENGETATFRNSHVDLFIK